MQAGLHDTPSASPDLLSTQACRKPADAVMCSTGHTPVRPESLQYTVGMRQQLDKFALAAAKSAGLGLHVPCQPQHSRPHIPMGACSGCRRCHNCPGQAAAGAACLLTHTTAAPVTAA